MAKTIDEKLKSAIKEQGKANGEQVPSSESFKQAFVQTFIKANSQDRLTLLELYITKYNHKLSAKIKEIVNEKLGEALPLPICHKTTVPSKYTIQIGSVYYNPSGKAPCMLKKNCVDLVSLAIDHSIGGLLEAIPMAEVSKLSDKQWVKTFQDKNQRERIFPVGDYNPPIYKCIRSYRDVEDFTLSVANEALYESLASAYKARKQRLDEAEGNGEQV